MQLVVFFSPYAEVLDSICSFYVLPNLVPNPTTLNNNLRSPPLPDQTTTLTLLDSSSLALDLDFFLFIFST